MERSEIKYLVEEFVDNTLGTENPKGMCFTICYQLSFYLTHKGIKNYVSWGRYNNEPHYWINLPEYGDVIVDPSIRQFVPHSDAVIFVEKSDALHTESSNSIKYPLDERNSNLYGWRDKLLTDGWG